MINHEVIAENFHAELSIVLVYFLSDAHHCHFNDREHLVFEKLIEIHINIVLLSQIFCALIE